MFCRKCGMKLSDEWKICPECKEHTEDCETKPKTQEIEVDCTNRKARISGSLLLKILGLIAIVCFFCPLYMVSCAGQEVLSLNGIDLTFGMEYMKEKIDGNLMFGILALLPLVSFLAAFTNNILIDQRKQDSEELELLGVGYYTSAICSGATAMSAVLFTVILETRASETALKVTPCTSLQILTVVSLISMVIGGYLVFLVEPRDGNNKIRHAVFLIFKCCGKILLGMIICVYIVTIPFREELKPSTVNSELSDEGDTTVFEGGLSIHPEVEGEKNNDSAEADEKQSEQGEVIDSNTYIFQDSDKKYLTEEEVRSVEVDKLFIGRNEIFARHGYIFENEGLKQHFSTTVWYKATVPGNQFNADAVFNDFEKKNVELIKKVENEINGKVGEKDEKQLAIDEAHNFVAGKTFHVVDSQRSVEFTTSGEFIVIGYYGSSPLTNKYCTYSFSAEYALHKDEWQYLTFVHIEGVAYYFRCFTDGKISLEGNGEFSDWYQLGR